MDILIKKMTPGMAEDYARFHDATPYMDNGKEVNCYCVTWRSDDTYTGDNDHWYATQEERRARAVQFVKDDKLQGYLAYCGDRVVGWCNATANCRGGVGYLRAYWPIADDNANEKVKSIFCFLISPDMKRHGIATMFTERVCADAAEEGFDCVEAYADENPEVCYRGPLAMYEKCGFTKIAERDGRVVVRKALR